MLKKSLEYVFFNNFILKVFLCFLFSATWESGLEKVVTKFQGLSSTDCNFQGFSRPWIFILKSKDCQGDVQILENRREKEPNENPSCLLP